MTPKSERERDPLLLQEILSRIARIKSARAARQTRELQARWKNENIIESLYLRKPYRVKGVRDNG